MINYRAEIWDNSGTIGVIFDIEERGELSDVHIQVTKEYSLDPEVVVHEFSIKNLVFRTDKLRSTIADISHWASRAVETSIYERSEIRALGADQLIFELRSPQSFADNMRGMADLLISIEYSRLSFSISMLVDHSCLDQFGQSARRKQ